MYKVDVTPVVGLPQFSGWSQVASSNFNSSQLVCAFSISGDHAGNIGRDLTEKILQAQVNSSQELHNFITDLITQMEQLDVKLQIAGGVFKSERAILGTAGGHVFLKRSERTGTLLSSVDEVKIIEGKRVAGDTVVLSTHQASDFLNEIELKFTSGFDTDSVVTSIIPGLHGLDDSSLASIAFVTGGSEFKEEETLESVPDDSKVEAEPEAEPEEVTPIATTEQLLNIPPALKLRGAGKNRTADLSKLGQVPSTSSSSKMVSNIWQKLIKLVKTVVVQLKKINWHAALSSLVWFFSRIKTFLIRVARSIIVLFRKITARDIYLKSQSPRQLVRVILPIAASIVVIGGLIGFRLYKSKQQLKATNLILKPIATQFLSAKELISSDPILARETIGQVITQLEQLEKDFQDQKKSRQLVETKLTQAREFYDQISGQEEFGQLEIFYDLRLIDSEFLVSKVDATDKRAAFLDDGKKQLVVVNLENKQAQKIESGEVGRLIDVELTDTKVTALSEGVKQLDLDEDQGLTEIIAEGDSNKAATLIENFATYIYVLNPEKRNIYRYSAQEEGYSDPIGWVSGAAGFDYSQVSSWAIDGDMWITTREGGLHKLAFGREQEFKITGLAEPFSGSLQVFTHEDLDDLYILEPTNHRLVILTKEGEFLKEIKSKSLASTTTLFVSKELSKAFAVSGSIVYAMGI
jgi:hypothetical protein